MSINAKLACPLPIFHRWTLMLLVLGLLAPMLPAAGLELLARTTLPGDMLVEKTRVGGLSGISFDSATRTFWLVSDDSTGKGGPPRLYQMRISREGSEIRILRTLILRDKAGRPLTGTDAEGVACTGRGGVWVTSEGIGANPPWVRLFNLKNGRLLRDLPLPAAYPALDAAGRPVRIGAPSQASGVQSNRSLESCALSPDLLTVYAANETSLLQEKADREGNGGASLFNSTQVRISALHARSGQCLGQKLYVTDAGCFFGSVSELACLDDRGSLLVLERRVSGLKQATGNFGIRIYRVSFQQPGVTDLRDMRSVTGRGVSVLRKTLFFDSLAAGIDDLDNVEGLCLGSLPGVGPVLVVVSDNNFSAVQQSQILVFRCQLP